MGTGNRCLERCLNCSALTFHVEGKCMREQELPGLTGDEVRQKYFDRKDMLAGLERATARAKRARKKLAASA